MIDYPTDARIQESGCLYFLHIAKKVSSHAKSKLVKNTSIVLAIQKAYQNLSYTTTTTTSSNSFLTTTLEYEHGSDGPSSSSSYVKEAFELYCCSD